MDTILRRVLSSMLRHRGQRFSVSGKVRSPGRGFVRSLCPKNGSSNSRLFAVTAAEATSYLRLD